MDQKYNNTPKVMTAGPMTAERMTTEWMTPKVMKQKGD
jgi:hypothetical protein